MADVSQIWPLTDMIQLLEACFSNDLDAVRIALRAYARAIGPDAFKLDEVEAALRDAGSPVFLIALKQDIAPQMTSLDLCGNPDQLFVLTLQKGPKPRRVKLSQGWPADPAENMERLKSAGLVVDRGVPLCSNCGELGHVKKHCKQEVAERENLAPTITCVYCQEQGHRARDCPKERVNPFACKNCKQEGHKAADCTEPRSAEGVECRKCNEKGHFSRDVCISCPQNYAISSANHSVF